jgi:hypothetical protein
MDHSQNAHFSRVLPSFSVESENSAWRRAARFVRYFDARQEKFDMPGMSRPLREFLNRRLVLDPTTAAPIPQHTVAERQELEARHRREYALATREFMDDDPRVVAAWIERVKNKTAWLTSVEYQKAKRNSLIASFVGVFISSTGLYPTKISMMGVEFDAASRVGFCVALIMLVLYLWASANMLLRDTLVKDALLEIQHKRDSIFKIYDNRWSAYIFCQHAETAAFQRRLTTFIMFYACGSLFISAVRNAV